MNAYTSQAVVLSQVFANELLLAISTRPGAALVAAGKIRLSIDPAFNPTPQTTLASLAANEANFSGYPAGGVAAVFSAGLNVSPSIQGSQALATFIATVAGPFVPNVVTGYWIDDGTNPVIMEKFANGATASFANPGDFLDLNTITPVPMTGNP